MRITDLLKPSAIELNVSLASKSAAIDKLVSLHEKAETSLMLLSTRTEYSREKNWVQQR